ncbi:MAG: hypothetical protein ACRBCK_10040 [Alphaproteobacteria bacterium]
MLHDAHNSYVARKVSDLELFTHLIKSNYNTYWISALANRRYHPDNMVTFVHKNKSDFFELTNLKKLIPNINPLNLNNMFIAEVRTYYSPEIPDFKEQYTVNDREAEVTLRDLVTSNFKSILCFNNDNDIEKTDILIKDIMEQFIKKYDINNTAHDFYYINVPEFLSTNTKKTIVDTSPYVKPITISNNEEIHNDINNLRKIVSEIVEMSDFICGNLSKKNAPEHRDLKDLILKLKDSLTEFSNTLNEIKTKDELNAANKVTGNKVNGFLKNLEKLDSVVDKITDSPAGSFTLTYIALGLLNVMGVPPLASLATGTAFFGNKHANYEKIKGKITKE